MPFSPYSRRTASIIEEYNSLSVGPNSRQIAVMQRNKAMLKLGRVCRRCKSDGIGF